MKELFKNKQVKIVIVPYFSLGLRKKLSELSFEKYDKEDTWGNENFLLDLVQSIQAPGVSVQ